MPPHSVVGRLPRHDETNAGPSWPAIIVGGTALGAGLYMARSTLWSIGSVSDETNGRSFAAPYRTNVLDNAAFLSALHRRSRREAEAAAANPSPLGALWRTLRDGVVAAASSAAGAPPGGWPEGAEIVIELTEFVQIPSDTTAAAVELCVPLRGELRVHTYLDRALAATVKLATAASSAQSATASFRSEASVSSFRGPDMTMGQVPTVADGVRLQDTELSDLVDTTHYAATRGAALRFVPARTDTALLMTYSSTTAEEVSPAVVAREAVVSPGSTNGSYVLTVALEVSAPALDVCVELVLPKGGALLHAPEVERGRWGQLRGGRGQEFQWHAGDFDDATEQRPKIVESMWEYCVPPEVVALASRPQTPYSPPPAAGDSEPWRALVPGVTLSYMAPVSSSGVRVRKITTTEIGGAGDDAAAADPMTPGVSTPASAAPSSSVPGVARPRVTTTASYRTMYSQAIRVRPVI